jgi:phosphate transport system substrate-binding protein
MRRSTLSTFAVLASLALAACGGGDQPAADGAPAATSGGGADLTGAGATFPNPLYTKWFDAYAKSTGVRINYQSIGSGGGIRQFTQGTVDFGATDGPMTDEQISAVGSPVLHLPTVLGAVVLTYNLPDVTTPLVFDAAVIADIFLGKVTRWNDPKLAALNPGVTLPNTDIIVVHRSDGSGTSYVFTDYLSKVSAAWKEQVGVATAVKWPIGLGGKGNEGVTQQVKQTRGALGYVENVYAAENKLPTARVKNAAGNATEPSLKAVSAAAGATPFGPDSDFRVSITNAPGADAYPIASFTWLLIHPDKLTDEKGRKLKGFLDWMLTPDAQRMAADLHYAPLPVPLIELLQARLAKL